MKKNWAKYSNIYDREGNLIRHVDETTGKILPYTLEELEELVDKLANDKDENGKVKDPVALNNANWVLMQYYQKYGNPRIEEYLRKLAESKPTEEQVQEKLEEVQEEVQKEQNVPNLDPEYVEFEEIKGE